MPNVIITISQAAPIGKTTRLVSFMITEPTRADNGDHYCEFYGSDTEPFRQKAWGVTAKQAINNAIIMASATFAYTIGVLQKSTDPLPKK